MASFDVAILAWRRRAQFSQTFRGVVRVRLGVDHPCEEFAGGRRVTSAIEDVGQRVPEANVAKRGVAQILRRARVRQELDRLVVASLVSQVAAMTMRPSASTSAAAVLDQLSEGLLHRPIAVVRTIGVHYERQVLGVPSDCEVRS